MIDSSIKICKFKIETDIYNENLVNNLKRLEEIINMIKNNEYISIMNISNIAIEEPSPEHSSLYTYSFSILYTTSDENIFEAFCLQLTKKLFNDKCLNDIFGVSMTNNDTMEVFVSYLMN